ncbi:MAG TPA: hypothetical protein VKW78_15020 [Terriglobales bacterium]|nr:hypothetical protein [Terriglobales bacterium]
MFGMFFAVSGVQISGQTTATSQPSAPSGTATDASEHQSSGMSPQKRRTQKSKEELEIERKEQSQRILGVVPDFGTTSRHHAPPLTPGEKLHLFVKGTADPFNWTAIGIQAGISQGEDEFREYGQGASGYFKRYGAALADNTSSGFFANFLYPIVFKDDPRYFRAGQGSIKRRVGYSLAQEFVCHSDKGTSRTNFPNILGAFTAGAISNSYYPPSDRGFGLTMSRSAISLLYGSVGGLMSEFWPDIDRKVFHKKDKSQQPPTP